MADIFMPRMEAPTTFPHSEQFMEIQFSYIMSVLCAIKLHFITSFYINLYIPQEKSRRWETLNLSTDSESSINTIFSGGVATGAVRILFYDGDGVFFLLVFGAIIQAHQEVKISFLNVGQC